MTGKNKVNTYIVSIDNSDGDSSYIFKCVGTEYQMKKELARLVRADRDENKEEWDNGTTSISDIEADEIGKLVGYGTYSSYHINYTAIIDDYHVTTTYLNE